MYTLQAAVACTYLILIPIPCTGILVSPNTATISHSPTQQLSRYTKRLKNIYARQELPFGTKWPISPGFHYIQPALALKLETSGQEVRNDRIVEIHKGNLSTILREKTQLRLEDLFVQRENSRPPRCIILEGCPGSGKSTLTWKLCKDWGESKALLDYRWVLLLCLRDSRISGAKNLQELCMFYWRDEGSSSCGEREEAYREVCQSEGEGLLMILDGLDEVPQVCQSDVFQSLLEGISLPSATLLISTRASGIWTLLDNTPFLPSFHSVELLGFLQDDIAQYCQYAFPDHQDLSQFQESLALHPCIMGMLYVPLNCAIVTEVYRECHRTKTSFPSTITALYSKLCCCMLLRYLTTHCSQHRLRSLSHPSQLPQDIRSKFSKVCQLAYNIESSHTIKHSSKVPIDDMGFMQSFNELTVDKGAMVYCFLHHTIQQYLAAYYIQEQPATEQTELFQSILRHGHGNVLRFYAGLTNFENIDWKVVESACFRYEENKEISVRTDLEEQPILSFNVEGLHLAYESNVMAKVFTSIYVEFRPSRILMPFDWVVVGNCIARTSSYWEIVLAGGQMQDSQCCTSFISNMTGCTCTGRIHTLDLEIGQSAVSLLCCLPRQILENVLKLKMRRCNLDCDSAYKLQVPVEAMELLETVDLSYNHFGNGGLKCLLECFTKLENLKKLYLRDTEIGGRDVEAICCLLEKDQLHLLDLSENNLQPQSIKNLSTALHATSCLNTLYLGDSQFDYNSMVVFAKFLERNEGLKNLYLQHCHLSNDLVHLIAPILASKNIQEMDLSDNPFDLQGARALANFC